MKSLFISIFCIANLLAISQQNSFKHVKVGSQLFINPCTQNKPEFVGIEIYSRNDIYDKSNIDSITGKGLSQTFFNTKSLDGKRLPCSMGGRNYTVAAIDTFTDKGILHELVFLYDYYPLNLIMIDYETAVLNNEIRHFIKPKSVIKKKKTN